MGPSANGARPILTHMMIDLDRASFTYAGAAGRALDDMSLKVGEGEFVVVAGPSGCGKSTLALALGGYLHHSDKGRATGRICIDGLDVALRPLYEVADIVGLVQQNPENQFCTLNVTDEVAFGLENRCFARDQIETRLAWSLDGCLASHLRNRRLDSLSGGEKQRVAIAAMLAGDPRVLVFDEPTSNLDPTATATIFGVLDRIRRESGITIVVMEHKLAYLRPYATRLVVMERGRLVEEREAIPPTPRVTSRKPNQAGDSLYRVEGLTYQYGDRRAIDNVSLTLHRGQLVALMGDNGCGKTTLLRCLMGLLQPQTGRVLLQGRNLADERISELAREVGFIYQNPDHQLLTDTVWGEATLLARNVGLIEKASPRAEQELAAAGLASRRADHPFTLSYGQKRRLNLVSVVAHEPSVILADEPLIGQDAANTAYVMRRLRDAADGGACVVVAIHDPSAVLEYSDRVLFMEEGQIAIDAPPVDAFRHLGRLGKNAYLVA